MKRPRILQNKRDANPKKQIPIDQLETVTCEDCGYQFKGHFCPSCGQKIAEFNRPFGFVFYDFMGNFFAFDIRFFRSFWQLLLRPGFLTVEFFKGRRTRYSPPFRIFIFLSFILFLILQIITEKNLDKAEQLIDQAIQEKQQQIVKESGQDSLSLDIGTDLGKIQINLHDGKMGSIRGKIQELNEEWRNKLKQTTDPEERKQLETFIRVSNNPELVVSKFLKYLSWTFFILLPVFALLLKLFYLRQRQYFIRHLVFSVHLHSYLFMMLILAISFYLIIHTGADIIFGVLFFSFIIYQIIAIKRFYGQSIAKVILKFLTINFIFNIIIFSAVIYVLIESLIVH